MSAHGVATASNGESIVMIFIFISILLISCLPNASNRTYRET